MIVERGRPADQVILIAHGKVNKLGTGKYGDETVLGVLADGDHLGDHVLAGTQASFVSALPARLTVNSPNGRRADGSGCAPFLKPAAKR